MQLSLALIRAEPGLAHYEDDGSTTTVTGSGSSHQPDTTSYQHCTNDESWSASGTIKVVLFEATPDDATLALEYDLKGTTTQTASGCRDPDLNTTTTDTWELPGVSTPFGADNTGTFYLPEHSCLDQWTPDVTGMAVDCDLQVTDSDQATVTIGEHGHIGVKPSSKPLTITNLNLRDIDNGPLNFLSVSDNYSTNQGPIFGGNTRINGTIAFEGPAGDELYDVRLLILEGGSPVASARLSPQADSALIGQPFDANGKLSIDTTEFLFELPQAEAANVNLTADGQLSFEVKASSVSGETATQDGPTVDKLVRYTANNRYGDRDLDQGGDDWILPSVKSVLEQLAPGHCFGDMSNMNGGPFPPHRGHQGGFDVDGAFVGHGGCHFNSHLAADARQIIADLNGPSGGHIGRVFATYQRNRHDAFFMAIHAAHLADGRWACRVIRPEGGHVTHFHWIIDHGGGGGGGPCPAPP